MKDNDSDTENANPDRRGVANDVAEVREAESSVWGFWGTLFWGLLIGVIFVVVQATVVGIYVNTVTAGQAEAEVVYERAITDGDILSWATIASAIVGTLLVCIAIAFKRGSKIKRYLGLYPVDKKRVAIWTGLFIGLLIVMEIISSLFDRPVSPDVMREVYASADSKVLLFVGTVVAASIFEELFFRGFLMEGFSRTFIGPWGSVVLTAIFWSLVHVQYDRYGIATIFVIGLFFGVAKLRSGSTLFTIALHALNNAIAFFFLMLLSGAEA